MNSLDSVQMESMDLGAFEVLGFGAYEVLGPWCRWRWKSADYAEYEIHIALGASNNLLHSRNVLQSQETASQVPLPNRGTLSRKVQSQRLICFSQARSQPLGLQWQQLIANLVKLVAAFWFFSFDLFSPFLAFTQSAITSPKAVKTEWLLGSFVLIHTVFVQLNQ